MLIRNAHFEILNLNVHVEFSMIQRQISNLNFKYSSVSFQVAVLNFSLSRISIRKLLRDLRGTREDFAWIKKVYKLIKINKSLQDFVDSQIRISNINRCRLSSRSRQRLLNSFFVQLLPELQLICKLIVYSSFVSAFPSKIFFDLSRKFSRRAQSSPHQLGEQLHEFHR